MFNQTQTPIIILQPYAVADTTPYSLISFIFALVLSVVAAFMLALLFILYYKVFFGGGRGSDRLIDSDVLDVTEYI
jgi:hypothetical protein